LIVKALTVETALTLLVGTALMANVFTKEREMGNVDMLRMTLLSARQIVFGKLFAGFTAVLPLLLAATIAMIPLMGIAGWSQALLVLLAGCPTLYVCVWLALCLGMYASMITRRTSTSLLFSYFLNGAALFGFILATVLWRMVVHALSGVYPGGNPDAALYFSPLFAYMGGFSGGRNGLNARTWHVSIGWMISEISFFLLGWVIVMLCILKFKYRYMRDR
jgi:ABC-type transport system involved in multi-copper enzyme maturation permease subunit